MEISPLRGLRFQPADGSTSEFTAPPYDVISADEQARLLATSPHNIVRLTLGDEPEGLTPYPERADLLRRWIADGVLVPEESPSFYVYSIEYPVPGAPAGAPRVHFLGLVALGRLHDFSEGMVLPHEQTFPKVVEDRYQLLNATRTHLESIFLLYADREEEVDGLLRGAVDGQPVVQVEAKPREVHALYRLDDADAIRRLQGLFASQRPIIADGHHRYTTSLRFSKEAGANLPGATWQLMTFANLYSSGLSILATHRLVRLADGDADAALELLRNRLEAASEDDWDLRVETREGEALLRFPAALRAARQGVAQTSYGLLHEVVLGEWLAAKLGDDSVAYYKQGTGEDAALARGDGDLLLRLRPVDRDEFQSVVENGEVFPHKTTYFYPKLWSGLVLWPVEDPAS